MITQWGNIMQNSGRFLLFSVLALLAVHAVPGWSQMDQVPQLKAPINDDANIIDSKTESQLDVLLRQVHQQGGSQVAVLTVKDLQGLPIEMFSINVVENWQLGSAKQDNGVLLLIAPTERKVRIEVGQGLEGDLTDAHSKRIIDQMILPHFRNGQFAQGIFNGVIGILQRTDPDLLQQIGKKAHIAVKPQKEKSRFSPLVLLIFLIVIFNLFRIFGPAALLFGMLPGGLGGGFRGGGFGGRGGGFGGGGFSGGGGGFSGGGASGGW